MLQRLSTLIALFITVLPAAADNWMERLSDDVYMMQLSIPGTHDAATGEGFTWGEVADQFGKTQDLTLAQLWAAGVRAFDLRPAVETNDETGESDLVIYHGILVFPKDHFIQSEDSIDRSSDLMGHACQESGLGF